MSNNGLIGLPSGRNLMDAASAAIWCGLAVGIDTHVVNLPVAPDSIQDGLSFRYVPTQANANGSVSVLLNGVGPFLLLKQFRTNSGEALTPSGMPLAVGDIAPFRTLECVVTISTSDPTNIFVLVTSGIGLDDTQIGLDLRNSPSDVVARTVLGLASGATTTVGTAATRNVGTSMGGLVEVVDGSGDVNAALNIANRQLSNMLTVGIFRTVWASVSFNGAGVVSASFNSGAVTRGAIGAYDITFPNAGSGSYAVQISIDRAATGFGSCGFVQSGTRTTSSCRVVTLIQNAGFGFQPFDPDFCSVVINRIN